MLDKIFGALGSAFAGVGKLLWLVLIVGLVFGIMFASCTMCLLH